MMVFENENADSRPVRLLTYSTLYPSSAQPNHGVFVENRLRHLLATGLAEAQVIAPVPWFPSKSPIFGRYAIQARVPLLEQRNGIDVAHPRYVSLPKIGMSVAPASLFAATVGVARRNLRKSPFDLIDAHYFYPDGVAAALIGRAVGKPVVITARGTDISLIPRHPIARRMIVAAARRAAGIIAVSRAIRDGIIALGIDPDRITVLRNGVDLDVFRPADRDVARSALGITGATLLSVGHLIERKGHDVAIAALPRLKDFVLLIVGEGPERVQLEKLASELGVKERVQFLGVIRHEDLGRVYNAADALILASSREGWPNVLLESMACGTPVVASAIWGNPEVVSKPEAGVLMQSRTPQGVADAVELLFRQPPSRQATRTYAEQFSWHDTSMGQIRLFQQVLGDQVKARIY